MSWVSCIVCVKLGSPEDEWEELELILAYAQGIYPRVEVEVEGKQLGNNVRGRQILDSAPDVGECTGIA